jgi:hypothetical protein
MESLINTLLTELLYIPNILNLTVLIGFIFIYRAFRKFEKTFEDRVKCATRKSYLSTLRLLIISNEVPLEEKLSYYDEYTALRGNSWISAYVETVIKPKINSKHQERDR